MKKKYTTPYLVAIHLDAQITFMQLSGASGASESYDLDKDKTITPDRDGVINSLSRDNASGSWDNEW